MPVDPIGRAFNPRALIRLVAVWQFLLLAAIPAAILTGTTGIDFVAPIDAAALLFMVALALGMSGFGHSWREGWFWRISVPVLGGLGGLTLAGTWLMEPAPIQLDDLLILVVASFLVLLATIRRHLPRIVHALLLVGFVCQALWCAIIAYGGVSSYPPEKTAPAIVGLVFLSRSVYLMIYLLGLIFYFISRTAPLASQRQLRIMRCEATSGSATIHAAHLAYVANLLRRVAFGGKRPGLALKNLLFASGLLSVAEIIRWSIRLGPGIKARTGKGLARQMLEQVGIAYRHGIPSRYYYIFELFRPEPMRQAGDYLQRGETKSVVYKMLRGKVDTKIKDKLTFARQCQAKGIRAVPVILTANNGKIDFGAGMNGQLPTTDLFVKPQRASGGRGAEKWQIMPGGKFHGHDGREMDAASLVRSIAEGSRTTPLIVQPVLANHPDLADLNCGALATVRLVTCRNEAGEYEAMCAAFRMPRRLGMAVDNFHAGGVASSVDLNSGILGPATDLGIRADSGWFTHHPVGGAAIEGRQLPFWEETKALGARAHQEFPAFPVVGWDIGILADGPCIVEANGAPDLDIIQRTSLRPLGQARIGQLLAWHLRRLPPNRMLGEISPDRVSKA